MYYKSFINKNMKKLNLTEFKPEFEIYFYITKTNKMLIKTKIT